MVSPLSSNIERGLTRWSASSTETISHPFEPDYSANGRTHCLAIVFHQSETNWAKIYRKIVYNFAILKSNIERNSILHLSECHWILFGNIKLLINLQYLIQNLCILLRKQHRESNGKATQLWFQVNPENCI